MRSVPFAVTHETWEEADAAGRYNRGLVVLFRDRTGNHRAPIGAGENDDVEVYRDLLPVFQQARIDQARLGDRLADAKSQ